MKLIIRLIASIIILPFLVIGLTAKVLAIILTLCYELSMGHNLDFWNAYWGFK